MFLFDAQYRTASWRRRHSPKAIKQLGVWRWKGIQDNAAIIFAEILGKRVYDFGGADGPLGCGSEVIDIKYGTTLEGCDKADVIFSSHTLEHVPDLEATISLMHDTLTPRGCVIIHVPAWTCKRWRKGQYQSDKQSDHLHTFQLWEDKRLGTVVDQPTPFTAIDYQLVKAGFDVEFAEYVGDNSILVIGRRE